jgi:hypothetical protein
MGVHQGIDQEALVKDINERYGKQVIQDKNSQELKQNTP